MCRCCVFASAQTIYLKTLYLSANEITDEGALALARALRPREVGSLPNTGTFLTWVTH